ncbi:MAG: sigma-70 family RNA polymerase sigma factor [Sporichthyaceae bacterium]
MHEDSLVREHLPLVGYLVSEMLGKVPAHVNRADLTSAGLAALAFAARSFEAGRGVPFHRFASIRIRGALIDELRSTDWASRSVRAKERRREAATAELAAALGRTPTPAEIAEALGVDPAELNAASHDVARAVVLSLDSFAENDVLDAVAPAAAESPEQALIDHEQLGYLHDGVLELPERLRQVVTQYYFEERPMAETAAELGVSESRVSQMRAEALALLRGGLLSALGAQDPPTVADNGRAARTKQAYYAAVAARSDYRARLDARPLDLRPLQARTG